MIKAIETRYKGYRFRSRLEARWAVFFDALGVKWEYEKEGYDLGEAGYYLPDFWLPMSQIFVEIKPNMDALKAGADKADALCEKASVVVLFNLPSEPDGHAQGLVFERNQCGKTYTYGFWFAYIDHALGLLKDNNGAYYLWRGHDAIFNVGSTPPVFSLFDPLRRHPRILKAFEVAVSARFEHGEQPLAAHRG